jgi:hypothetical protein
MLFTQLSGIGGCEKGKRHLAQRLKAGKGQANVMHLKAIHAHHPPQAIPYECWANLMLCLDIQMANIIWF